MADDFDIDSLLEAPFQKTVSMFFNQVFLMIVVV